MRTSLAPRQREGSVLAIVAVMLVALLAIVALAVDLGMAYTARAEAQRMADAAALAGASAYLDFVDPYDAVPDARLRAYEYVQRNVIRNEPIDTAEDVNVEIIPAEEKVRVWVQRRNLATWFARFLGVDEMTVNAAATAQAQSAGAAKCLKPWALMDLWAESSDEDNVWDEGETWEYDPADGDWYQKAADIGTNDAGANPTGDTGYGSGFRNAEGTYKDDWGRQIHIKAPDPNSEYVPNPGVFLPWRIGEDDAGAADYRNNIRTCNPETVYLGEPYPIETGNMVGPTYQGVTDLVNEDPGAQWDEGPLVYDEDSGRMIRKGTVVGSEYNDILDSPRVIKVAMMDPGQIIGSGMQEIVFNNFALLFLEEQQGMQGDVVARFLYYVDGSGSVGTTTSPLVKMIRLVE